MATKAVVPAVNLLLADLASWRLDLTFTGGAHGAMAPSFMCVCVSRIAAQCVWHCLCVILCLRSCVSVFLCAPSLSTHTHTSTSVRKSNGIRNNNLNEQYQAQEEEQYQTQYETSG